MEKLNEFHSKAKKNYKLVKLATKAELCLSRDNAKKIIKKAEKFYLTFMLFLLFFLHYILKDKAPL